jgi:Terminase large subunit, T4likevirus-type, N-terminal
LASSIPLIQAPPDRLAYLRRLQAERQRREAERLKSLDVFSLIGYEPNCVPRHEVRKRVAAELGIADPFDQRVIEAAAPDLPEPCGECPQERFHAATEDAVLYGGASGGGKSYAITAEGIRCCVRYPRLRVLLVRRSYDELEESIFPALRKFGMAEPVGGKWNGTTRELSFSNGSVFRFRYLETVEDASRRQGGEYQLLLVDEMTLMAPGVVDILRFERLRASDGLPVIGLRATTNPGGASHGQVRDEFIDATDHGGKVVTDIHGLTVKFIQAKATDNPHLDPGHRARLDAIPDPARKAAMRDGDWDQWSGMIFKQYRWDRHTMDPITLPESWTRYNGIDWGFAKPWAVLWGAFDADGRVWLYREIYETGVGEAEQAKRILAAEAENEDVAVRYADDSMWDLEGDAKPKSDVYAENGVYLTKAGKGPGSRITGWQRLHSYMAEGPACPHHRANGWETCPMIHIFRTCEKTIFELKNLPYARTGNPEDADTKANDHAMDALRYMLVNLGSGPSWPDVKPPEESPFDGVELLEPRGQFAWRPDEDAPERNPQQGALQKPPWA